MEYEFDKNKNTVNSQIHGYDFSWLGDFDWDTALIKIDDRKDYDEERIIAYGFFMDRLTCLVYTERGDKIRAISWRKATKIEVNGYVKEFGS